MTDIDIASIPDAGGHFGEKGYAATFIRRRIIRIVPLYWAATAILVWFVVPYASTKAVLGSLFFTPRIPSEAPLLFVGWTLIFEMFFYAVFAIALLAKRRFAVVAGVTVVLICFSVVFAPDWAGPSTQPPASTGIGYLADPIIIEFVFGMMIALVYRAGGRLPMWATISLIAIGFIWLAATLSLLPRPYSAGIAAALIVAGMALSSMPSPKRSPLFAAWCSWATSPTRSIARTFYHLVSLPGSLRASPSVRSATHGHIWAPCWRQASSSPPGRISCLKSRRPIF